MKLRNLILAVIAGAALLTGCNKEVDLGPAKLEVNPTDVAFSQSIIATQDITLTATRDWAVTGLPDWIALSKESGPANTASQTITLSVTENKGNNRNATITFTIGFSRATLTVSQVGPEGEVDNGDGTKAKPFNVAGVIDYVTELGADVTSPKNVYVAGKISAISEAYTTQYGNGSFVISDDGETTGPQFTAYRVLYLGNKKFANGDTQIEVGDDVIVYGKVVNYKGNTPETSQNAAFLYSLNGVNKGGDGGGGGGESAEPQGKGTLDNPFNVAAAIAKAVETGETATETEYYIKGKVGTVTDQFNAQYGNATFTMVDEGFSATFTAYRVKYFDNKGWALGGKELAAGDEVIVCAKIVNFKGNTPETSGGYVYSINGEGGGGVQPGGEDAPKGNGTQADPFNPKAAAVEAGKLETGAKTESDYYIKGIISSIKYTFSAQYGTATFDISEDGTTNGTQFTCYSVYYYDNKPWVEGNDQVEVGKEVLICGKLTNYNGTLETASKEAYIVSMGGSTPPPSGEAGTAENPFTVAQAIAKAVETGETATAEVYYIKGKVAAVSLSAQYKNADLDLIDEGNTEAIFKAFRIKGFEGADITGEEPIVVGDEVVVCGNIVNYKGNTPETTQGGKLVTWNGKTSFDGGGDTPGGDTPGIMESNVTMITGTNAYDDGKLTVTYNGQTYTEVKNVKFGKGSAYGNGSIILPAGTMEIEFFAVGWKGADATLQFTIGETLKKVNVTANEGAANTSPYTMTVTDSDHYTVSLGTALATETTVKVETVADVNTGYRAFLFGVHANKTSSGGDTPGGDTPGGDDPKLPVNDGLTEETAFTIEDAIYVAKNGAEDKEYFVKAVVGKDISIKNGTASFELVDGTTDGKLTVVKAKSFDGAEFDGTEPLEWLDEVILKGKVKEYSTLPALLEGVFVKWNGKSAFNEQEPVVPANDGLSPEKAFTPAEATQFIKDNGDKETTSDYYVKGKISSIKYTFSAQYGTATFNISEDGTTEGTQFTCYGVYYLENKAWVEGNTQIAVGDEVIAYGKLTVYSGTYETSNKKAYLYSLNGKTKEANDGLSPEKAFTPAEATQFIKDNGDKETTTDYYVKGKVSSIKYTFSAQYGTATFNISEDGTTEGTQFTCYGVYYLENKAWVEGNTQIAVGDEVIAYGKLTVYSGTYETSNKKAYIYSLNGVTTVPETGGGGDEPGGGETGGNDPVTIDFSTLGYENGVQYVTTVSGDVTVTFAGGDNDGKYYNTGSAMRIYGGGSCTVSSTKTITKIEYTFSAAANAPAAADIVNVGTYDLATHTWTGTSTAVTIARPSGSGHWRLQKVVVSF